MRVFHDLHGPAPMFQRWFSPATGHLPSDDLGAPKITTTPSLPADAFASSCCILFFVPVRTDTASIVSFHFLHAPIDYQAGSITAAI